MGFFTLKVPFLLLGGLCKLTLTINNLAACSFQRNLLVYTKLRILLQRIISSALLLRANSTVWESNALTVIVPVRFTAFYVNLITENIAKYGC